jgi:hypothetical protein
VQEDAELKNAPTFPAEPQSISFSKSFWINKKSLGYKEWWHWLTNFQECDSSNSGKLQSNLSDAMTNI